MNAADRPGLRLFTGLSLTDEVREQVQRVTNELSSLVEGVRWVPAENLHVTLKFIGPCAADDIPCLVEAMRKAARHLPLNMEVGGVGAFPSLGSARVLWVGARDLEGRVEKVFNVIDKGALRCGVPREKRGYTPHITIGRSRKSRASIPPDVAGRFTSKVGLEVLELTLFASELKSTGAVYSIVEKVGL